MGHSTHMRNKDEIERELEQCQRAKDHADNSRAYYKIMKGQVRALEWVLEDNSQ